MTTQELASALGVSLRTITRDLNWLRDAGLPVTAQRGRLGGVTMPPGSGLDLTRLTPGERDHLSLTGLDEKQRAELDVSAESRRALSKIVATQSRRGHELLPLTDVVHVDSRPWLQARASGTTPASLIGDTMTASMPTPSATKPSIQRRRTPEASPAKRRRWWSWGRGREA